MRHVVALLVLGALLAQWVPFSAAAEDLPVIPTSDTETETEEVFGDLSEEIEIIEDVVEITPEAEEEMPLEPEEIVPGVEELPVIELLEDIESEEPQIPESPVEEEFFAPFNLLMAPEESEEVDGEVVYDFPVDLFPYTSNGAFASGGGIGPHLPGAYSFDDLDGQWDSVSGDFTRWNDPDTSYTFNRLDLFLTVQDLPGLATLDEHPLTAGMVEVNIYAADESWHKGALIATSLPLDAATLFLQKSGVCRWIGEVGIAPASEECIAEFTFDTLTLEAGQRYLFEVTAEEVVSAAPFFRDRYYYPSLLVVGAGVSDGPYYGSDGVQDAPRHNTGAAYLRLRLTDAPPAEPLPPSILFLPGIKGSRLYGGDEQLWEPNDENDLQALFLDSLGLSVRNDIHTKKNDIIDDLPVIGGIYEPLIEDLATLYDEETISDWEAVSYDWRLSLDDIVNKGAERDGGIYYGEATSTPYIEQTLRRLSENGARKVTIIAHSNGGLVAKALMQKLGDEETERLIDKVVFVGVPQSGAPQALGAVLFGMREGIPKDYLPLIASKAVSRQFAEHSPMAYHLLPSAPYFTAIQEDTEHQVIRFDDDHSYEIERTAYGPSIDTSEHFYDYLLARDGGRGTPAPEDIEEPNVLNSFLLSYAENIHASLDQWTPPAGITLYEIAGWGADTISGVRFDDICVLTVCTKRYTPMFIEDGDGVVPVPSAQMAEEEGSVQKFWINLKEYNVLRVPRIDHGTLFQIPDLRELLGEILLNEEGELPFFIADAQPDTTEIKKRLIFLHSPLTLGIYDDSGNHTGVNEDGSVDNEIPDTQYGEFGDVKYLITPADTAYDLELVGQGSGTFSLDIEERKGNEVIETATLANIPVTSRTVATADLGSEGLDSASSLQLDKEGDGVVDDEIAFSKNETVIYEEVVTPEQGETEGSSSSGGARHKDDTLENQPQVSNTETLPSPLPSPYLEAPVPFISSEEQTNMNVDASNKGGEVFPTQTASIYDAFRPWIKAIQDTLYTWWTAVLNWLENL